MADYKSYSDCYLYQKYPLYQKRLMDAIMRDPIIDKSEDAFKDVIYEVRRTRVSDSLVKILNSTNTILLACENPLPRAFKVFCAKDLRSKTPTSKVFVDCTGVITKVAGEASYRVEDIKLVSYLVNSAVCMAYHKNASLITRRSAMISKSTECFAKCFTFIIDYLAKISIQESSKIKTLYLASMYFLYSVLELRDEKSRDLAKKIAGISDREASMMDILLDKFMNSSTKMKGKDADPFENIKTFISSMREVLHLNEKVISTDMIVEKWLAQFGPSTIFGLEYFPAFSAMITDAYNGGYLNQQKTIEKVCGSSMVEYSKEVLRFIDSIV